MPHDAKNEAVQTAGYSPDGGIGTETATGVGISASIVKQSRTDVKTSDMLRIAVGYANVLHWHIFRTVARTKIPFRHSHGHLDATTDMATIRRWWTETPDANIALACAASGIVVLDFDDHDVWRDVCAQYGARYFDTPCVETRRGLQFYYQAQPGARYAAKLVATVDVKHNGFVMLPPSVHPSGHVYGWAHGCRPSEREMLPAPDWLPRRAEHQARALDPNDPQDDPDDDLQTPDGAILGARYWLRRYCRQATVGSRHTNGVLLAGQLRAARLTREQAWPVMQEYAAYCSDLGPCDEDATEHMAKVLDWTYAQQDFDLQPCYTAGLDFDDPGQPPDTDTRDAGQASAVVATSTPHYSLAELTTVFRTWLHMPDAGALYAILAALVANKMPGDPVWLLAVDVPGGGKTEMLMSTVGLPGIWPTATLTEGSLLSGTSRREKAKDASGGLLRAIGDEGVILLKDFGSILSMNLDTRGAILQALREVYDGSWTRHVGTDGGKSLSWTGKVGVIGGATPAIDAHHAVMSVLGERFVFFRPDAHDEKALATGALRHLGAEVEMRAALRQAVSSLFAGLLIPQTHVQLTGAEQDWLISLATLTVHCRSGVLRDGKTREVEQVTGCEAPTRLTLVLAKMLTALRVIGLDNAQAYGLVRRLAMSSMPVLRRKCLDYLAQDTSWHETPRIATEVRHPANTTRRALEDLQAYSVVDMQPGHANEWRLSDFARELYGKVAPDIQHGMHT